MGWWERKERRFDGSSGDESEENKKSREKKERMKIWKRKKGITIKKVYKNMYEGDLKDDKNDDC